MYPRREGLHPTRRSKAKARLPSSRRRQSKQRCLNKQSNLASKHLKPRPNLTRKARKPKIRTPEFKKVAHN